MKRFIRLITFLSLSFCFVQISSCNRDQAEQQADENTVEYSKENIATVRLPAEPDKINPLITTSVYSRIVYEPIFLYLLQFDPQSLEIAPQLAKSRPQIEELTDGPFAGGVSYTFEILDEAVWDDGTPILAKDFEFTLKVLFNPLVNAAPVRAYLEFIRDIEIDADNPKKFTVYTNQKYIVGEAAIGNIPIYPTYVYDKEGLMSDYALSDLTDPDKSAELSEDENIKAFADIFNSAEYGREKGNVVGSGAYSFESWESGQRIVLKKKKNWWGDKLDNPLLAAYPDQITYKIIPDQTTTVAAIKAQEIDVTAQIDAKDFTDMKDDEMVNKYFNLYSPTALQYYYIGMNTKDRTGKLSDKRVRRALAHLVDVDQLINDLFYGLAERTVGPIHPSKSYYNKDLKPIEYNVEKAQSLLAAAGWEDSDGNGILDKEIDGEQVDLKISYITTSTSKFGRSLAEILTANFKKAGVELDVELLEFRQLIERLRSRDYEMNSGGWGQDPVPADLKQIWHTESDRPDGSNRVGFGNAESDALIDQIRVTLNEDERVDMYMRIQEVVYEEQPYIFLFSPRERIAIHKRFNTTVTSLRPGYIINDFQLK
ncbi:MAG: ABC transporter substrate-binding protein [Saprospiraceae bacterium]|nr:ABC transporter substrate-binding protein [Saprospiraceae bacterium]